MAGIATIFQSIPFFLSEAFALLTILSAIPIYTAARTNPMSGALSYVVTVILVLFVSSHEALMFLFTNGVVGVSLGITSYLKLNKFLAVGISSVIQTIFLCILNYGIGISIFGVKIPGAIIIQLILILGFTLVYNFGYQAFADFIYKRIKTSGITDIGANEKNKEN